MATDKKTWVKERYSKRLKEGKETYREIKEFLADWVIPGLEKDEEDEEETGTSTDSNGNAEADSEVSIGSFTGTGDLIVPAEPGTYYFTSPYKWRWGKQHYGVDIAPPSGKTDCKILAAGDGVVIASGPAGGFGQWIVIKHSDNLWTLYGHMPASSRKVKVGDTVKKGQHIAMMGKEGQSTGIHLHFEMCRDWNNRKGNGSDGKCNTFDPETMLDFRKEAIGTTFSTRTISDDCPNCRAAARAVEVDTGGEPMHGDYSDETNTLTDEGKKVNQIHQEYYPYKGLSFRGSSIILSKLERRDFLIERVGWGRTTQYEGYVSLDEKKFIHQPHYDGYEGNLYCPDAKTLFENLLLKTRKPYFEIISGFRYSNKGQLSPHEAGCAIDILVRDLDEVREIADCAWQLGVRSIAIGGDFAKEKGFIHLDIAPKGEKFQYGEIPIYGGPGKWDIR